MGLFSRFVALLLFLTLLPLFIIISIICLLFNGRPILFKQKRVGHNYKIFFIYKFRTMEINSGDLITKSDDSRITSLGLILRSTKLDEIPQLLNIIKGDMRFIGPRPEVYEYFEKNSFKFLKKIKPGLSDYSSILFRNESLVLEKIKGDDPYRELLKIKLELANYYSIKKTFLLDLKLTLITIMAVFFVKDSHRFVVNKIISDNPKIRGFIQQHFQ
jgi:lipopolysaccharide/colanic/teichoic acid biosynthesis glycosyltransferase